MYVVSAEEERVRTRVCRAGRLLFNTETETIRGRAAFQSVEMSAFLLVSLATECHQLVVSLRVGFMVSERLLLRELRGNEVSRGFMDTPLEELKLSDEIKMTVRPIDCTWLFHPCVRYSKFKAVP